jgi:repressor LexA
MTKRQRLIYDQITTQQATQGYPATIREIADAVGIRSPNGVMCHLQALRAKGYVTWNKHHARTIRPLEYTDAEQQ